MFCCVSKTMCQQNNVSSKPCQLLLIKISLTCPTKVTHNVLGFLLYRTSVFGQPGTKADKLLKVEDKICCLIAISQPEQKLKRRTEVDVAVCQPA